MHRIIPPKEWMHDINICIVEKFCLKNLFTAFHIPIPHNWNNE